MSEVLLPNAFKDLAEFSDWILPVERDRHRKRVTSDLATARRFYDALFPRMEAILDHLNARRWEDLTPADRNLFVFACAFMEVTHPIELGWKTTDIEDAFPYQRLEFLSVSARSPWEGSAR